MDVLRFVHSWLRYGFLLVAVAAVVWLVVGLVQRRAFPANGTNLMRLFSTFFALQWVVGIALLLEQGSLRGFGVRHFWEHFTVMTAALVLAHAHYAWRRRELPDTTRYRNNLLVIVGVVVLVVVGILALPAGMQWQLRGL